MYKLIAIDADGTLLDSNFNIHKDNITAIKNALKKGIKVVLCSGRSFVSLADISETLGIKDYCIAFNGSIVYDLQKKECIMEDSLALPLAIEIFKEVEATGLYVEPIVYKAADSVIIQHDSQYMQKYIKISQVQSELRPDMLDALNELKNYINKLILLGKEEDLKKLQAILSQKFAGRASLFFSASFMLEVVDYAVNKGNGLKWLANKLDISPNEIIAIGDNYNDISMLEYAGVGAAVGDAVFDLKKIADYISPLKCVDGAVGDIITTYCL